MHVLDREGAQEVEGRKGRSRQKRGKKKGLEDDSEGDDDAANTDQAGNATKDKVGHCCCVVSWLGGWHDMNCCEVKPAWLPEEELMSGCLELFRVNGSHRALQVLQPGASSELISLQAAQQHGVHVVVSALRISNRLADGTRLPRQSI